MLEVDALLVSALNANEEGTRDAGWEDFLACLAFYVDNSTEGAEPAFVVLDEAGPVDLRVWITGRPSGTGAYLTASTLQRATPLPAHIDAGFRGGGLAGRVVVREPQRVYTLHPSISTHPEYQTSGRALYDYIVNSPHHAAYVTAFREALEPHGAALDLKRYFDGLMSGEAVSEGVRQFRTLAKTVEGSGKEWAHFLSQIPYADRTHAEFRVIAIQDPPPPELDLGSARTRLQAAIAAARSLIEGDAATQSFAQHFDAVLASFNSPAVVPRTIERISRRQRGTQHAPTLQYVLQSRGLSDEAQQVIGAARSIESIYGGMGSWNDTPYANSAATSALYAAAHLAFRTAVNQSMGEK